MSIKINRALFTLIISAIFLIILCLFSACNSNVKLEANYSTVINQYQQAINKYLADENPAKTWGITNVNSERQVYGYEYVISNGDTPPTKYAFKDLDNDGLNELVISNDNYISNIYSIVDEKPELMYLGWEKSYVTLREGNILMKRDTGGWNMGCLEINTYKTASVDDYNNKALNVVESVSWDGLGYLASPMNVHIYYKNANGEITKQVTKLHKEIPNLIAEFEAKYPIDESVEWVYFDE